MANWLLAIVGAFLVLDSLLALVFGRRYMLWGLEYMPAFYRDLIKRFSELPPQRLLAVKLAEGAIGAALLLAVQ